MKTERIVLSFIAVLIGILVAAGAFYFYQTTKLVPTPKKQDNPANNQPSAGVIKPTPPSSVFLAVDSPKDEDVVDNKSLTVSGKTVPDAVIIITTAIADATITPATNGNFTTNITLDDGTNQIEITAIAPNGDETRVTRSVTYSTENF